MTFLKLPTFFFFFFLKPPLLNNQVSLSSLQSNPNYNQDKARCEYLHNKLAHIKKLISEYDQQQLRVEHAALN